MKTQPFNIFLSHKYEASEINKYFFNLLNGSSQVHFEVDIGTLPTNVTRLERMIRDCDAFIGIYPIIDNRETPELKLKDISKYFRLEVGIALRANKPGIIFYDKRFASTFYSNNRIRQIAFDNNDILSKSSSPFDNLFVKSFDEFKDDLLSRIGYDHKFSSLIFPKTKIGIFRNVPLDDNFFDSLSTLITDHYGKELIVFPPSQILNEKFMSNLLDIDFFIVDTRLNQLHEAFLQGCSIPIIRSFYLQSAIEIPPSNPLFEGYEVGYKKNLIQWDNAEIYFQRLSEQFANILAGAKRISTQEESINYFDKANLRKEVVFVSYSGEDRDEISEILLLLKKKFQNVFNYRDKGESITSGKPWVEEIFGKLAKSRIGIPIFSESYFKSKNCSHELNEMVALKDNSDFILLPIKLRKEDIKVSPQVTDIQYSRRWEFASDAELIDSIIDAIDKH